MTPSQKQIFQDANHFFGGFVYPSPAHKIEINGKIVWVKRDDQLQLGCSKQRSIPYSIYHYLQNGEKKFVVSSSGNAALVSAFCAMQTSGIEQMFVLLSNQISDTKLQKFIDHLDLDSEIEDLREEGFSMDNLKIKLVDDPRQAAFNYGKIDFINLRGSTDDSAIPGFSSISDELTIQVEGHIDAVFVPSSSGTTVAGIYQGFQNSKQNPQIHIVQTSKAHALVKNKVHPTSLALIESEHPAESIVDQIGHRRKQIEEIIENSNGNGWLITAEEAAIAKGELESYGIYTSFDSALSFVAYKKASQTQEFKNPVLILTG